MKKMIMVTMIGTLVVLMLGGFGLLGKGVQHEIVSRMENTYQYCVYQRMVRDEPELEDAEVHYNIVSNDLYVIMKTEYGYAYRISDTTGAEMVYLVD